MFLRCFLQRRKFFTFSLLFHLPPIMPYLQYFKSCFGPKESPGSQERRIVIVFYDLSQSLRVCTCTLSLVDLADLQIRMLPPIHPQTFGALSPIVIFIMMQLMIDFLSQCVALLCILNGPLSAAASGQSAWLEDSQFILNSKYFFSNFKCRRENSSCSLFTSLLRFRSNTDYYGVK